MAFLETIFSRLCPDAWCSPATFRNGKGFAGYMDCSADPMNVAPPARLIVDTAVALRKTMPPEQPLVVLMAEQHDASSHIQLQRNVISEAVHAFGKKNVTVAHEYAHDKLGDTAESAMERSVPKGLCYRPGRYDPAGQATLAVQLGYYTPKYAPAARLDLFAFCLKNEIRTRFAGASLIYRQERHYLNPADPLTAHHIQYYNKYGVSVPALSEMGMDKFNAVMVWNTLDSLPKDAKGNTWPNQVAIVIAGAAHVYGCKEALAYKTSLCAQFRNTGAGLLPVLAACKHYTPGMAPRAASVEFPDSILIHGLPKRTFSAKAEPAHLFDTRGGIASKKERKFVRALQKKSGITPFFDIFGTNEMDFKLLAHGYMNSVISAFAADQAPQSLPHLKPASL